MNNSNVDITLLSRYKYRLLQDVKVNAAIGSFYFKARIPAGTITDFASVPRALWSFIPPTGRHTYAALLHDMLYSMNGMLLTQDISCDFLKGVELNYMDVVKGHTTFSRKDCDRIFYETMLQDGVSKFRAVIMYNAVRCFGKLFWDGKK